MEGTLAGSGRKTTTQTMQYIFNWALDTVPDEIPDEMAPMLVEGEFLHPVPRTRVRCLTEENFSEKWEGFPALSETL